MDAYSVLLNAHLLLASPVNALADKSGCDAVELSWARNILSSKSYSVVADAFAGVIFDLGEVADEQGLLAALQLTVRQMVAENRGKSLLVAVALLQTFIQNNYTGPVVPLDFERDVLRCGEKGADLKRWLVTLLSVQGQIAYELCTNPAYLVLALLFLEELTGAQSLFLQSAEDIAVPSISADGTAPLEAVAHWWRFRALLVQISLIAEPVGPQPLIASSLLDSIELVHAVVRGLPVDTPETLKRQLYVIYYLENVKCALSINTEHLCLPVLQKVQKLTDFQFVLTGARAKRTKFQQKAHAGLIILARSSSASLNEQEGDAASAPGALALNSDLLFEKPHFESIGNEPLEEQLIKKQKLDGTAGLDETRLLPVALRQEDIPIELREVDPNNQPRLSDYDNIQLLLRLYAIRQTSPARDPIVDEELASIIGRVVYQDGQKNWSVFARALWERSVLETTKAKTIERGILQMQSLVEELGLKIQHRYTPESDAEELTPASDRMKYIHQLPFLPRWALDRELAEKYMSMGILRSAVEIYERLELHCDAALCYAAVGDEKQASLILQKRIENNPNDARAYSILGDIRQDPALWEKSWEVGKYVNAKNSLGKFYYSPPANSGVSRDFNLSLKHLNDSLRLYPLSFDTWYFYGCIGLECGKVDLAAEAFSRCVALDDTHALSWSNLSAAYTEQGKIKEAHSCLKRAIASDSQRNWRIWENYMTVSVKLHEWEDVLLACRHLIELGRDKKGERAIDMPVLEKLSELLTSTDYPGDPQMLSYFQRSCVSLICELLPSVITSSARCWRIVARVELWRKRPYAALECHEKAYRSMAHNPDLEINEGVWNSTVDTCEELVAAYESLGPMEGKHGAGDLVCKDWKYKARSTIKSLLNKGRNSWEGSEGWEKLVQLRNNL
ncbi:ADL177Cp [Eremothecium gossypii ATCC 10895]|uniref:ADL177Cp n=1 Tax=Eremothecium gossypii (strain ATCC 10895 / CBS 109.51 / FGSC 9923 / NRRL Y-1056) TaxID=284811 RepID=Q75AU7_EREGS|nr:ADL177Cp [Eremothecium gossypii ATCC 10895]AAS51743.2 ADL177Cp [Eremothecium gossypii ATCC 10895]